MNKRNRLSSLIALVLVLCMIFSFCSVLSSCGKNKDPDPTPAPSPTPTCSHANTSLKNQKAATCSAAGYTGDVVCNDCTAVITPGTAIAKLAHTSDAGTVTKNPTCIETGVKTFTCTVCAAIIKTESVATVAHNDIYHDAQDGNHWHTCTKCTLNASEKHTPTNAGTKFAATCVSPAYTEYTCADCGGTYKVYSDTELALGHDMTDWILTESTCLAPGSKTQSCKRDGCTESHSLPIPISTVCSMVFSHYETNPTCTENGTAIWVCEDCGTEESRTVKATGVHKYGDADSDGAKTCQDCGKTIKSIVSTGTTAKIENVSTDADLEVTTKEAAIQFPADVLGDIAGGASLEVSADTLDDTTKNSAVNKVTDTAAKEALKDAPVYDFTVKKDGAAYTDTFASKVTITLPYDNGDNDADGIVIYYLAENGNIEAITDVVYNAETKEVTFFVEHFSFYAVAFQETQAMKCKRGNHAYEKTSTKQTATCYQFGYTLYECSECHKQTIDDIAERLEHAYGDIIAGKPTCEEGSWAVRICSNTGCGDVLQVSFAGATGHKADKPATCETASTCTVCGKTVARALGHAWTDWQVVKQPTEAATGLRRRNCTVCGKTVEETLATTGTIEPLKYESYSDLINLVGELLGIKGASFNFTVSTAETEVKVELKMMETSGGYRMAFTATMPDGSTGNFFYDNGALVLLNPDGTATSSDINYIVPITMEAYKEILEEVFVILDERMAGIIAMLDQLIVENKATYAEAVNKILASLELEYTYDDLSALVQSFENVYAYLAIKLGYTTSAKIEGDVVLPTSEDFRRVLELFMTKSEANGVVTYTYDETPVFEAIDELLKFLEENSTKSIGEVFYAIYGADLAAKDASITDFDKFVDYIAAKFPGTYTVKNAVDAYITLADEKGLPSITEIYAILDTALAGMLEPGASVKDMVDEMGEMTLDAFVGQMMDGATMADLYGMVKQYAAGVTFGDLGYRGMTVNQIVAMGKNMLPMVDLTFDLTLKYSANGELILFELTQDLSMTMDPEADPTKMNSLSVKFVRDDAITVDIPAAITVFMNNVSTKLDANGNLIVEGLVAGVDYDFSASGYGYVNLKDAVVYDAARSLEAGYDIYTLKEEYWHETDNIGEYYYVNGKYYSASFGQVTTYVPSEFIEFSNLKNYILKQLNALANPNTDDKYGSTDGNTSPKPEFDYGKEANSNTIVNTETRVYSFSLFGTSIGKCYQDGETWRIALNGMYGELKEGVDKPGYYFLETMTLDEFVAKLKITSTVEANTYTFDEKFETKPVYTFVTVDGKYYPLSKANISYADGKTFQMNCVVIGGNVRLFNGSKDYRGYQLFNNDAAAVTLPEYDDIHSFSTTVATFDAAGNLTFTKIKGLDLYKLVPSYFIKVDGNIYKNIDRPGMVLSLDTRNFDTLTLPSGKTLYVAGESNSTSYFYENGYTAVYGYVKADSGVYVQTIALTKEGSVAEVMYRYAEEVDSIYLEYFDISTYVTENNGVYTVSAEAIAKLKALCNVPETNFSINVEGTMMYGSTEVTYTYALYSFVNMPEITLDMMGGVSSSEDIWGRLFGGGNTDGNAYDVIVNDDGTVTLIFNSNYVINNVRFPSNATLPSDDLIVKNQQLSAETGLDIYTFNGSYTTYSGDTYVYRNGKYYTYGTQSNYSFLLSDKNDFVNSWRIADSRYRFSMVGSGELAEGAPVYETEIQFTFRNPNYGTSAMTVYTFFLNGIMYAAVEAEVTGESLLTFERYMPINDYMKSLVFELELSDANAHYYSCYVDGKLEKVYRNYFNVYETTESGQKMADPKYNIGCNYVIRNGAKMFIKDYSWRSDVIKIGSEVTPDTSRDHRREQYTQTFSTGTTTTTVTLVSFIYENTYTYTANFVKLAGRLYRYDWYEYYLKDYSYYLEARMTEDEFKNQALDKVWYYVVIDDYGNRTYYSEFIPSDFGFTPKNEIDQSVIEGQLERETLLGYTAEGLPIYELLYFIETSGDADWDVKTVTVDGKSFKFHHKNGMGYLEVNEKYETYYVKARLVEMADGTEQIFCFIASGKITGSEANEYVSDYFDGYLTVDGNKLTITEEFLEVVNGNNKNEFFIEIYVGGLEDPDSYYYSYRINGYEIETFFMMGKK